SPPVPFPSGLCLLTASCLAVHLAPPSLQHHHHHTFSIIIITASSPPLLSPRLLPPLPLLPPSFFQLHPSFLQLLSCRSLCLNGGFLGFRFLPRPPIWKRPAQRLPSLQLRPVPASPRARSPSTVFIPLWLGVSSYRRLP
ncbi:hypothetical protein T310_8592, partial [Rasamsonia emersonii CBS 393.64]